MPIYAAAPDPASAPNKNQLSAAPGCFPRQTKEGPSGSKTLSSANCFNFVLMNVRTDSQGGGL